MADHHGIGVSPGLHVIADFQRFIQVLCRLSLLLILIWNHGHLNRPEAVFVSLDIFFQRSDELIDNNWWHHNACDDLLRLLHSQQKVHDEFMLPLKYNRASGKDSSSDMCWNQRADV